MAAASRLPDSWVLLALLLGRLALLGVGPVPARALHNVTAELFGAEAWGTLAAFGDLNSDKQTDLFVLRESQCLPGPSLSACPSRCSPRPLPGGPVLLLFPALLWQPYLSPFISNFLDNRPPPPFFLNCLFQTRILASPLHSLTALETPQFFCFVF